MREPRWTCSTLLVLRPLCSVMLRFLLPLCVGSCRDDWSAFQEFAASVEDPEEVVDAAAEVAAVEKEESVLVEQMCVKCIWLPSTCLRTLQA